MMIFYIPLCVHWNLSFSAMSNTIELLGYKHYAHFESFDKNCVLHYNGYIVVEMESRYFLKFWKDCKGGNTVVECVNDVGNTGKYYMCNADIENMLKTFGGKIEIEN